MYRTVIIFGIVIVFSGGFVGEVGRIERLVRGGLNLNGGGRQVGVEWLGDLWLRCGFQYRRCLGGRTLSRRRRGRVSGR